MSKPRLSKIRVETSRNLIFFKTVLNLFKKEFEQYHELGEKILEEFEHIKKIDAFKEFKEVYEAKEIPQHPWQYLFYSIHTNEDLSPKSQAPNDMYGSNRYKYYNEKMYPLFREIFVESDFEKIYGEKILGEYKEIIKEIQRVLDKEKPEEELFEFWGREDEVKLIFIPDPLRMNGGGGASRKNKYYTFTGCIYNKEGNIEFNLSHYISNLLHEYSHSFQKGYTFASKEIFRKNMALCEKAFENIKEEVDEELLKTYTNPMNYFEETYMRAIQVFLNKKFWGKRVDKMKTEKMVKDKLKRLEGMGFLCVYDFYNKLEEEGKDPGEIYFEVMEELAGRS